MSEISGRMTDSWNPSSSLRREAIEKFPHVVVDSVIYQFRDYYQAPEHAVVLTRSAWDRKFMSWCSRREERWVEERRDQPVEYDPITGMPVRPKPMKFKEKEA